ncbi:MAG: hypothetical protein HOC71_10505 [Candidatus Latescibacteria bacterium]|jgi:hypothetical protein|nr:hypothetical protein [Candidatus Latescibacterota bacterium]
MNNLIGESIFRGNWKKFSHSDLYDCLNLLPDKDLLKDIGFDEQIRWMTYLYSAPKTISGKTLNNRNHVIGLYDPFAKRKCFPAGLRFCINVYTGCSHWCKYCYSVGYIRDSFIGRKKKIYREQFVKDIEELKALNLTPSPLHLSNSTDPLQPLENVQKDMLWTLNKLSENQNLFTTITILTKNPELLSSNEYLTICREINNLKVEVSCAFFDEKRKSSIELCSPSIRSRLKGMASLRKSNISVALRLDPLFPREPLSQKYFKKPRLTDYGAPVAQTEGDINNLLKFANDINCYRIIVSPLKLTFGRYQKSDIVERYLPLYKELGEGKLIKKGNAFRMPNEYFVELLEYPKQLAKHYGIEIFYCKQSLFNTK